MIDIVLQAERLDMLSSDYSWIIVTEGLDLPSYSKTSLHNSRLLFLRNFYPDMKLMNSTCVNKWPADAQLTVGFRNSMQVFFKNVSIVNIYLKKNNCLSRLLFSL